MSTALSTHRISHKVFLEDGRNISLTQDIYKILKVRYDRQKMPLDLKTNSGMWAYPVDVDGQDFKIKDIKNFDTIENFIKRESKGKGRGMGKDYNNAMEEIEKMNNAPKKTKEELTEIDKCKKDCRMINRLIELHPRKYKGFKIEGDMSSKEIIRRRKEAEIEQVTLDDKLVIDTKKTALKYKEHFHNQSYWFLMEDGDFRDNFDVEDVPVVVRSNVENDSEAHEYTIDPENEEDMTSVEKLFNS